MTNSEDGFTAKTKSCVVSCRVNHVNSIYNELIKRRCDPSFSYIEILDYTQNLIKARLYFESDLFIQVYRNDKTDVTNFLLMYGGRRIYARDEKWGVWHRHPVEDASFHDYSPDGQKEVEFEEFLDEVYAVLQTLSLI